MLNNIEALCAKYPNSDFTKVSLFGTFLWNWTPLRVIARDCNPRAREALNRCQNGLNPSRKLVNFILADFPNFPGPGSGGQTIVDLAEGVNLSRAKNYANLA